MDTTIILSLSIGCVVLWEAHGNGQGGHVLEKTMMRYAPKCAPKATK